MNGKEQDADPAPEVSRRKFGMILGGAILTPMIWEHAMAEVKETSAVPDELMIALLDAQGERGIYENPERFEELRTALTNKIQEHILIRDFPVPDDIEPITGFQR